MVSLKVDGLSTRTHIDDLESLFEKYGKVGDVYIPKVIRSSCSAYNAFYYYKSTFLNLKNYEFWYGSAIQI